MLLGGKDSMHNLLFTDDNDDETNIQFGKWCNGGMFYTLIILDFQHLCGLDCAGIYFNTIPLCVRQMLHIIFVFMSLIRDSSGLISHTHTP